MTVIGSQTTSYIFLGFGAFEKCLNCNNTQHQHIKQWRYKTEFLLVTISKMHGPVYSVCPICGASKTIANIGPIFKDERGLNDLTQLLLQGKKLTKSIYENMDSKDREYLLKRLMALKQYELIAFIGNQ